MNKHQLLILALTVLLLACNYQTKAQFIIETLAPQVMVEDHFVTGDCVTVSNISYTGSNNAKGYFSGGATSIGLEEGIFLATGNSENIAQEGGSVMSNSLGTNGDMDLNIFLATTLTFDAAVLEFDFVPSADVVTFNYVFGSEEYPEYVCSTFNDVFGFFISGPGIVGGTQNIALIPGTDTYVGINTVNPGVAGSEGTTGGCTSTAYASFYNNNNASTNEPVFDGYTDIFQATSSVIPCETYHIKIAIADAGDGALDSAVFLEANSFSAGGGALINTGIVNMDGFNSQDTYEGCVNGYFSFVREDLSDNTTDLTIAYTIGGSAIPNVDYAPIETAVTIPAGQDSVVLYVDAFLDGIEEGIETIELTLEDDNCSCTGPPPPIIMDILDATLLTIDLAPSMVVCPGESVAVSAAAATSGGTAPLLVYFWSDGSLQPTLNITPTVTSTFSVTVTDLCGNQVTDDIEIIVQDSPPDATIDAVPIICAESSDIITLTAATPGGTWIGDGIVGGVNSTGEFDPSLVGINTATVVYAIEGDCGNANDSKIITLSNITVQVHTPLSPTCGFANGQATADSNDGLAPLSFEWSNGETAQTATMLDSDINYVVTVTDANGCSDTGEIILIAPSPITATVNNAIAPTCANDDGQATANSVDGLAPLSFAWSNGTTTPTVSNLAANSTYTVTVTDANFCTATAEVSLAFPPPITATVNNPIAPTCANDDGQATANSVDGLAPLSFAWSNGTTTPTVSNLAANSTYTVTVIDANTCTATAEVLLAAPAIMEINLTTEDVLCAGDATGSLITSINNGAEPYTYEWSGGLPAVATHLETVTTGTYTLTVTDTNACTATTTATIFEPETMILSISSTNEICSNSADGTAVVTASGGTPTYIYNWSTGVTSNSVNGLTGGTYTVTVTDNNSCTATATTSITTPAEITANISPTDAICFEEASGSLELTVNGGTVPYNYNWNNLPPQEDHNGTVAAGAYQVTITDANACTTTAEAIVSEPLQMQTNIIATDISCFGDNNGTVGLSITNGVAPYSFDWANGLSNQDNHTNLPTGDYVVTITDANGCTAIAGASITEPNEITASLTTQDVACNGATTGSLITNVNNAIEPITYSWSNGLIPVEAHLETVAAGTYNVTVTDANGCSAEAAATIVEPTAILVTSSVTEASCGQNDGSASIDAAGGEVPLNYAWSHDATISSNDPGPLSAGNYVVTVTDNNGCLIAHTFSISDLDGPMLNLLNSNDATCEAANGSISVNASGGAGNLTITWSHDPSLTTGDATSLTAGNYTITVADENNCEALLDITINDTGLPNIVEVANTPASCGNDNGSLSVLATGISSDVFMYAWSHDASTTGTDATGLPAGDYTVTVTNEIGCTAMVDMVVIGFVGISVTEDIIDAASCGESNGSTSVVITDGTEPVTYEWSHDTTVTGNAATNLAAGEYTVIVTDANNCTSEVILTVNNENGPTATVTATATACATTNGTASAVANGGTAPYTYLWNDANAQTTANATDLAPGDYTVTITDANNCIITTTVTVPGFMPPPIVTCGEVTETSVEFIWTPVLGAEAYEVSINGNIQTLAPDDLSIVQTGEEGETITISVVAVGAIVCGFSEAVDWQCTVLTTECPPQPANMLNLAEVYCLADGIVPLTANPTGGLFTINGLPATNLDPNSLGVGTHHISYSYLDDEDCLFTANTVVSISNATVVASPTNVIVNSGETIALTAFGTSGLAGQLTYTWSPAEGLSCTDCPNPIASPSANTTYTVSVVEEFTCTASASVTIGVTIENTFVVPNAFSPNGDGVNDLFRVSGNNIEGVEMHIYNRWGQAIYSSKNAAITDGWDGSFNNAPMKIGVYVFYAYIHFKDNPNTEEEDGEVEFFRGNVTLIR